jgi:hypothetical protein
VMSIPDLRRICAAMLLPSSKIASNRSSTPMRAWP